MNAERHADDRYMTFAWYLWHLYEAAAANRTKFVKETVRQNYLTTTRKIIDYVNEQNNKYLYHCVQCSYQTYRRTCNTYGMESETIIFKKFKLCLKETT